MLFQQRAILTLIAFSAWADASSLLPRSHALAKREQKLTRVVTISNGAYFCTESEVASINYHLGWMKKLAGTAYDFLLDDDSETTAAYIAWFGERNANPEKATSMRRNVYDAIWKLGVEATEPWDGDIYHNTLYAVAIGCLLLADSDMIENADNFMLFAFEVKANPDNAKKQVDMESTEPKYKIARRLLAENPAPPSYPGGASSSYGYPGQGYPGYGYPGQGYPGYGYPGTFGYPNWPPPWC
ncbi:hypothetical protein CTA2_6783 [Colletotrichum tanaceti]|uniref:Uncharacterized protein n=1 Tax=Colletotrichum tanaceti TaxID=1306861 RepID=A0A4U6X372_9PEZI|nr:hypothetical protein CTA2_6783 [Colletotrichum tanaceti]TKW49605.1 hypothetical protein CTA1_5707 [Colletotrichum tanaceti]